MFKIYTILITDSNELVTSIQERILRRSKLVDTLHFLTNPVYKNEDMSQFDVTMEYKLPVSGDIFSIPLMLSTDLYKNQLEYKIPFDTNITKEPGDVEINITFSKVEMDGNGEMVQKVRKVSSTTISILPVSTFTDLIPDSALSALDQRLIMVNAQIQALDALNQELYEKKADNLVLDDKALQLTANGERIGDAVDLEGVTAGGSTDGNMRVVEF